MIDIIRSETRGSANHGWLDAKHSFSFADYHDPDRMGFGSLRVINEDRIEAAMGFGTHPHRDMEIITYIIDGALEHKDSMGNGSVIRPGDVQRMTAGTGVLHSEFNPQEDASTHLLQIWILPEQNGLTPGYEETSFSDDDKRNQWCLLGSRDGRGSSVTIHQDVDLAATILEPGQALDYTFAPGRRGYLQVVKGELAFETDGVEERLKAGDGATIADTDTIRLAAVEESELLLFDMG